MSAVLKQYHQRIDVERSRMRAAVESSTFGQIIDEMLLPVGPASGQLINVLVKSLKAPRILELGTSYGYSGIWLAEAARATGGRLTTMELSENKSVYAREMSKKAGRDTFVDFMVGDALDSFTAWTAASTSCWLTCGRASTSLASRPSIRSSGQERSSSATT